jgi:hypothetical protein
MPEAQHFVSVAILALGWGQARLCRDGRGPRVTSPPTDTQKADEVRIVSRMRPLSFLVHTSVLTSCLLLLAAPALACKCTLPAVADAREDARALFEGRVLAIEQQGDDPNSATGKQRVTLAVVRSWKGLEHDEQIDVFTNGSSAACGYMFEKNTSYLIYAGEHEGKLSVSLCSRTRPLADAAEDLALLGAGSTPVKVVPKSAAEPAAKDAGNVEPIPSKQAASAPTHKRSGGCATGRAQASLFDSLLGFAAVGLVLRRRSR